MTKNAQIDKTGSFEGIFKSFFGNSFIFSQSNELWKSKRKATAHAFYKDRLVHMLEVLKDQVLEAQTKWNHDIDACKDKAIEVDMADEILKVFQKFLSTIVLGQDIQNHTAFIKVRNQYGVYES